MHQLIASASALHVLDQAIVQASERGSTLIFVLASWMRSHAHYRGGELAAAEADAQAALEAGVDDWFTAPVAFLADVLIERGELDAAEALFATYGLTDALFPNLLVGNLVLDARGRLRCAQATLARRSGAICSPSVTDCWSWRRATQR